MIQMDSNNAYMVISGNKSNKFVKPEFEDYEEDADKAQILVKKEYDKKLQDT